MLVIPIAIPAANAAEAAAPLLQPVDVQAPPTPAFIPAAKEAEVNAADIQKMNAPTTEETLKYQPELVLRSRYIGDNNALLALRDTNIMQTARTLVMADGMRLSNFLGAGWDYGPLWSMTAPEEISRADILYGAFDARYSGNAMGGAVILHTRLPDRFEANIKGGWFEQHFSAQGESYHLPGYKTSAMIGDAKGRWHYRLLASQLANRGQPMSYGLANGGGGGGPAVTGARPYEDTWMVNAESATQIRNGLYKLELGYDLASDLQLRWQVAYQKNTRGESDPHTFLRTASGAPVYSGDVTIGGQPYSINGQKLSYRSSERLLTGLSLQGRLNDRWSTDSSLSWFSVLHDAERSSGVAYNDPQENGPGTLTEDEGSGWGNLDLRFSHRNSAPWAGSQLTLGYHLDQYQLDEANYAVDQWRSPVITGLEGRSQGKTRTQAVYLQNQWPLGDAWQLRLGVRQEWWRAFDGSLAKDTGSAVQADYPQRSESATSPKASLDYFITDDWRLSLAVARAVRFPTLGELYQGSIDNSGNFTASFNPDLKPERALQVDFGITHYLLHGQWRVDLWQNHIRDSIFHQTDTRTGVTSNQNIDRVVSEGIGFSGQWQRLWQLPLDIQFNLSYTRPKIERDSAVPDADDKDLPRVPRWRGSLFASYLLQQHWQLSSGLRYASDPYDRLDNSDGSLSGFGYTDSFLVWDAKLRFVEKHWSWAFGINNLTDRHYYAYHPYPGRTFFTEVAWHVQ